MPDRLTLSVTGFVLLVVASAVAVVMLLHYDYSASDVILIISILGTGLVLGLVSIGINWRRRSRRAKEQS